MRVDPKKFSALMIESGLTVTALAERMNYSAPAGLRYWVRKIKAGSDIRPEVIRSLLDSFSSVLLRRVGIRELVYATDLPRETGRVRKARAS
jgi:transposase-like protein